MTFAEATPAPTRPSTPDEADPIHRIRAFNRWYTRRLDLLTDHFLASPFTLGEARVLWEIVHGEARSAADLSREMGLDPAQVSRLLKRFETRGLIRRSASTEDGRRATIEATDEGRAAQAQLDVDQHARIAADVAGLDGEALDRLTAAMADVHRLADPSGPSAPVVIRPHRSGEVSWVCHRQAAYYADVWGFRGGFEALVMEIGAKFLNEFDPRRDASFLVEVEGRIVGSVFICRTDDPTVAKLRLLWVESEMRGHGLGARLVDEAVRFAREAGYARLTLWTQEVLEPARRIYARAGFRLTSSTVNRDYGVELVSEVWDLEF